MIRCQSHHVELADTSAVVRRLQSDHLTQGPVVPRFEQALAAFCGAKHAVAVSSGTAALTLACRAAGLGPGDEAITSPMSFVGTANAIEMCGATTVFADTTGYDGAISWCSAKNAVTERTRVILPVDYAGYPSMVATLRGLARQAGAYLIVDACHSLGATCHGGMPVGAPDYADMTCFSFHPTKLVAAGEGGAVVTDHDDLAATMRLLRDNGRTHTGSLANTVLLGCNARMSELHAALALSQLRWAPQRLGHRRALAQRYEDHIGWGSIGESACHLVTRLAKDPMHRRQVRERLLQRGIETQVHYRPIHLHDYYQQRYPGVSLPHAEDWGSRVYSLPCGPHVSLEDVDFICEAVKEVGG